jgi:phospholipid-binding lipoprotein MlaA
MRATTASAKVLCTGLAVLTLLSACAAGPSAADPWEGWNRKVYALNERLDAAVLKPVAVAYTKVVPSPVRSGVNTFYGHFTDLWSGVNNLLQGKVGPSLQDLARVGTNVFLGLTVFDVATELGLDRQDEDLGQTLGRWGLGPGPYVIWPLLGPSTLRDSVAMPFDRAIGPSLLTDRDALRAAITALGLVNERVALLDATRMLDDMALDKYSFVRDGYLQRRRSLVFDGNPPEPASDAVDAAPEPETPASPAPAAASAASQPS